MSAESPAGYFQCPGCGKRYALRSGLAGKTVQCKCGQKMIAPSLPKPAAAHPTPSAAKPRPKPRPELSLADALEDVEEPAEESASAAPRRRRSQSSSDDGDTWKWWYYVVVGVLIGAFSVWQIIDGEPIIRIGGRRSGPIGGFILAAICIVIGLASRPGSASEE